MKTNYITDTNVMLKTPITEEGRWWLKTVPPTTTSKIATKIQKHHLSEPIEIWLNRSPTTRRLEKKHIETRRKGRDVGNDWPHNQLRQFKIRRD